VEYFVVYYYKLHMNISSPLFSKVHLVTAVIHKLLPVGPQARMWLKTEVDGYEYRGADTKTEFPLQFIKTMADVRNLVPATVCQELVRPTYVQDGLKTNNIFIVQYYVKPRVPRATRKSSSSSEPRDAKVNELLRGPSTAQFNQDRFAATVTIEPVAFAMCRMQISPQKEKGLYIDIICSSPKRPGPFTQHGGAVLLVILTKYARERNSDYVALSALPHVLTYYPKYGFKHTRQCVVDDAVLKVPASITQRVKSGELNLKKGRIVDEEVLDFMVQLQEAGFGKPSIDCLGISTLATKRSKRDALVGSKCGSNGFYMRACLRDLQRAASVAANTHLVANTRTPKISKIKSGGGVKKLPGTRHRSVL